MSQKSKKREKKEPTAAPQSAAALSQDYPRTFPATKNQDPTASSHTNWMVAAVCIFLAGIIWVVFGQTLHHEFVNLDDGENVYDNPIVAQGINFQNVGWAFTHAQINRWAPVATLVHMLDWQLYGSWAGGHHLTSIVVHTATTILLFLMLRELTGAFWRSAFVAALSAIHPLRVEAVAWVSAQLYLLSGLFFMLTLWAYIRYVRQPHSRLRYGAVLLFFILGLLSKEILVTVPCVLLLLDYWPLNRMALAQTAEGRDEYRLSSLLAEKIPLFALSAAFCVIALIVGRSGVQPLDDRYSLSVRVGNALVAYASYLGQLVYPAGLAVVYPHPGANLLLSKVILSAAVLIVISVGVWLLRHGRPYLLTGWLWFLVILGPAIGLIQQGSFQRADRYTYLSQIGIFVMITWMAAALSQHWRHRRWILGAISAGVIASLIAIARIQTAYWKNSESLWIHTLACNSSNPLAHNNLGTLLLEKGKVDEAVIHFQKALEIRADYVEAQNNLGNALLRLGRVEEAIDQYKKSLAVQPKSSGVYHNLGNAFLQIGRVNDAIACFRQALEISPEVAIERADLGNALLQAGRTTEAIVQYKEALKIDPFYLEAHNNLGNALLQMGRAEEAVAQYNSALKIKSNVADLHYNLGYALQQQGRLDEAAARYRRALEIEPSNLHAMQALATLLATCSEPHLRDGAKAVELAEQVDRLTPGENPVACAVLAAAYAEAGRFPEALKTAGRALQLATDGGNSGLADLIRTQMKLYERGTPFHQPAPMNQATP